MYSYFKRVTITQRGRQETYYRVKNDEILSFNVTAGTLQTVKQVQITAKEIDVLTKDEFARAYEDFKKKYDYI